MSDNEYSDDDIQIIEDFSDVEEDLQEEDTSKDPFAEFLGDEDDDDKEFDNQEEIKSEAPPLNSFAGGGIFSIAESNAPGSSAVSASQAPSTIDGTSIIGDSTYSAKPESKNSKYTLPTAPNLSAIKNKTVKRELYQKYLKEKQKIEKLKNKERRKKRLNETEEEIEAKRKAFGRTTAQVDYHQKTIENMRVWDETTVPVINEPGKLPTELKLVADPEVQLEELDDEFAGYWTVF